MFIIVSSCGAYYVRQIRTLNFQESRGFAMEVVTGIAGLSQLYQSRQISRLKKRVAFRDLIAYLHENNDFHVCSLYGLRCTGKTTLMAQAAEALDPAAGVWIQCEVGDSMQDVKNAIRANPACQFIFIDEATRLENFIDTSSILADRYCAEQGKKIVLTGADSLKIRFSLERGLHKRTHVIHTTYIPFKEHRYLLGTSDIDNYIKFGGILSNGNILYTEYSNYVNGAIAINIQRSLEQLDNGRAFGSLLRFYAANELTTLINKIIDNANRNFMAAAITKEMKTPWNNSIVSWLKSTNTLTNIASEDALNVIYTYLQAMDVIYRIPGSDGEDAIFTQPGLRYSQVQKLIRALEHSPLMNGRSPSERKAFCKCLDGVIKVKILEEVSRIADF